MESTKILADFPKQVVLLKETASAGRLRGKKRGAMKRLSDGRRSREFREWCRKRANAGRGNKAFEAEILVGGKRAAKQLAEMVQGAGDFAENLREFGKKFTAGEMRILREHEPISQELFDKFLDIIFQMAARFFELGGLKPPPAKELPHTFVFLCIRSCLAMECHGRSRETGEARQRSYRCKYRDFRDVLRWFYERGCQGCGHTQERKLSVEIARRSCTEALALRLTFFDRMMLIAPKGLRA
jgi:hypothetical protein